MVTNLLTLMDYRKWRRRDEDERVREELERICALSTEMMHIAALYGDLAKLAPIEHERQNVNDPRCTAALLTRVLTYIMKRIHDIARESGLLYVDLVPIIKMMWAEYGQTLKRYGFTERDLIEHVWISVCLSPEEMYMFDWCLSLLKDCISRKEVSVIVDELRRSIVDMRCFRTMSVQRLLRLIQQLIYYVHEWAIREVSREV